MKKLLNVQNAVELGGGAGRILLAGMYALVEQKALHQTGLAEPFAELEDAGYTAAGELSFREAGFFTDGLEEEGFPVEAAPPLEAASCERF